MALKIALVYNLKRDPLLLSLPEDYFSEFDSEKTIESIASTLRALGFTLCMHEFDRDVAPWLLAQKPDCVFNIAEGFSGTSREAQAPALFDLLHIPYTGSGVTTMAACLDKAMTKKILLYEGIETPRFQLFYTGHETLNPALRFPMIVKPNREGSAKVITVESVVHDEKALRAQIDKILLTYEEEVLVEEFIEGRELTVGILGNVPDLKVLPILEIDFSTCKNSGEYFYTWRMKEFQGDRNLGLTPRFICPALLSQETMTAIEGIAKKTFKLFNCFDFARLDFRLDAHDTPYLIEVNPLPGLDPEESNFPMMARADAIDYMQLIDGIITTALRRHKEIKEIFEEKKIKI